MQDRVPSELLVTMSVDCASFSAMLCTCSHLYDQLANSLND